MKKFSIPELECLRCGHKWRIRNPQRPKVCPNCKRFNWDKPKEQNVAAD